LAVRRSTLVVLAVSFAAALAAAAPASQPDGGKRMSFHNRILLNRAVVSGLRIVQIMLAVGEGRLGQTTALVHEIGGRVVVSAPAVGYLRVEVPIEKAVAFVADQAIEAYQISSLSHSAWLRDGRTAAVATGLRNGEATPVVGRDATPPKLALPQLTAEQSRHPGYTGEEDVGLDVWRKQYPTFDGRGVTIAVLETGQAEIAHPVLATAKTLDGTDVPKLAGIITSIPADEPDDTRVELTVAASAATAWCRIGDRTYTLPRPGRYRFGLFTLPAAVNLVHRYGVIRDETTGDIRVDTDGDTDFQDETPIADVNDRLDVRALKLTHPRPTDLSFVIARGRTADVVYVYVARSVHESLTASAAVANGAGGGSSFSAAPGARVLLVRNHVPSAYRLHHWVEGILDAAARPDVDVLSSSSGADAGPDTAADFLGVILQRVVAAYGKPIFHAAGNTQLEPVNVKSFGALFSVGGSLSVRTFAALFGGAPLDAPIVQPSSAAGPTVDGAIKPDFLVPMHRIVAAPSSARRTWTVPKNAPAVQLPPGYMVSGGTSSAAPFAAGIGAVLVSAAKQRQISYSLERFSRAMRVGATFLAGIPASQQGHGVVDVNAAWRELQNPIVLPAIHTTTRIVHPLAPYAARGPEGSGILEYEGWHAGMTATRDIIFRRESGPSATTTYRVSWTGNDGTFAAAPAIALPLQQAVPLTVTIDARSAGLHSGLLNLHDPATGAIVFRTQATIFAAERADPRTHTFRFAGPVPFMRKVERYFAVPEGIAAVVIEVGSTQGRLTALLMPGNGAFPSAFAHVFPQRARIAATTRAVVVHPQPPAGTWRLDLGNVSVVDEDDPALVTTGKAEYAATIRLLKAAMHARRAGSAHAPAIDVEVENLAGEIREPVVDISPATAQRHTGRFLPTGLPSLVDIAVGDGAATLSVDVRRDGDGSSLELYLYDCATGECFVHDYTLPARDAQTIVVRKPRAGRWVAAVNPAPFPSASGGFVLDAIVAMPAARHVRARLEPLPPGGRWKQTIPLDATPLIDPRPESALLVELVDQAAQRNEVERPWKSLSVFPLLRQPPAAIGRTVIPLGTDGSRR
jgi:hypothetical protein